MAPVVIENPILNSPFAEPDRHFRFGDQGITNEIVPERRSSSYFVPIAQPKKKGKQLKFDTEWTQDRVEENAFINRVRERVRLWRTGGYSGVSKVTRRLLEYWTDPDRDRRLFFCQIEALETAIYVAEVAHKFGDAWIHNDLRAANQSANPLLDRLALKMATGSGKTVVMAMLIAWQTLNKLANPQDARFGDAFLIVTPGITIRDRLRVLLPNDPANYYRARDIVPSFQFDDLGQAKIVITNYHAFQLREKVSAGRLTKQLLAKDGPSPFTESPGEMVRRVCRELGNKRGLIVLNDEAHHCYRRKPVDDSENDADLSGDEKREAEKRNAEARIWISGLEAVKQKLGVKVVYDLSATPFFLKGSGYTKRTGDGKVVNEGLLFPWVVSDFSLIDAIEAGIVKVPRVPVSDDSMTGDEPTYRRLWEHIREQLPKKGRKSDKLVGDPQLPAKLQAALHSLYGHYEQAYLRWESNTEARARGITPPVFIVVCNNTSVSKLVFDYIAGYEKPVSETETVLVPGALPIFSNVDHNAWSPRPNSILVDSEQLESGEAMSDEFKKFAAAEIEEFKQEIRLRFPGRNVDDLTDEDLLREVMNTVGKAGKLGEHVKCVVSVSMLTEGWDANTVTHILGVRAFGTQLLCEQVVGRGLRRMSYSVNTEGRFDPEYAEVYGVPFSFIPTSGSGPDVQPGPQPTRVRSLPDRVACEITFPRLLGYRYDIQDEDLEAVFTSESHLALSTRDVPTQTENAPIVGQSAVHHLDELKAHRLQEVAFKLAKLTLEKYFRGDGSQHPGRNGNRPWDNAVQAWRFPQLLDISRRWLDECVTCKDNTFPQLLLLVELAHDAADRIYLSLVKSGQAQRRLIPMLQPYDTVGSTSWVDFDTTRPVYATDPAKCHISHVVADTDSWEQKLAQTLEDMPEVVRFVKNHNLGFTIPYTLNGEEKRYVPDYIVCLDDGHGPDDLLNLLVEVTGERKKDKEAKTATARNLWVPAVNNDGHFGRWDFLEISDPWDAARTIRGHLQGVNV
jgi:type III restriction enzyme